MKKLLIILIALPMIGFGQLPNGSIAPDFTLTDLNGTTHNLYQDYLDLGYTVFLSFSAVWSPPDWSYHTSGALQDLYINHGPVGFPNVIFSTTNDVMVLFIEGTGSTVAQLNGGAGSYGNFVTGTPFPIICTDGTVNSTAISNAYSIGYWPTIYQVCPDRTISESGQISNPYSTAVLDCAGACFSGEEVTLTLTDSYGDGWNGNSLTIGGVDYTQSYTGYDNPNDESFVFCMDLTGCIDVEYVAYSGSSWENENSWDITDASGASLATGGSYAYNLGATTSSVDYSFGQGCPVFGCMDPVAVNYDSLATQMDFSCTNCYATADIGADTISGCDSVLISTNTITNGSYEWITSNSSLSIGDTYQGGVIFYIDGTGQHGLVAAIHDLPAQHVWGCYLTMISGADGKAIGTGNQNTLDIVAECSETPIAAEEALAYVSGGYSDWYLPSKGELLEMYNTFGNGAQYGNMDGFVYLYWSSSEYTANSAWYVNFDSGYTGVTEKFPTTGRVRVIRDISTINTTNSLTVSTSGWNYILVTDSLG